MLSPFQIRNLRSSSPSTEAHDALIQISAPGYERTISNNPAATLKYRDEDEGDMITLGSSRELIDKLEEPVTQSSGSSARKSKDRMSIAMLLSEVQNNPDALKYHTFDIDEREEIQKLWKEIQERNKTSPPTVPVTKWGAKLTPSEDALIVQCRNSGMSWEETSTKLPGRSAIACRLHYERVHLVSENAKNEEKRNKLSAAYRRFRSDIWIPIAAELGITWQEAEALHWSLGKEEMDRRVQKLHLSTICSPEEPASSTTGDRPWWCLDDFIHTEDGWEPNAPTARRFEDHRTHHFNTTKPPQLRLPRPVRQTTTEPSTRQYLFTDVSKTSSSQGAFSSRDAVPAVPTANLTLEGKRQAQAAGDILRARTAPSRHRKGMMTATDHTSHQNRWANYKSQTTAFPHKMSAGVSEGFDRPSLSPEGKRQAQAAGDKLRSRTNPIRHSRPSRSGSLEHGVSKNRWSSYVAPRVARFDERHHSQAEPKETPRPEDAVSEQDKQPSLLEVFETELVKDPSNLDETTDKTPIADPRISIVPTLEPQPTSQLESSSIVAASVGVIPAMQQSNPVLEGFKIINDHLQGIKAEVPNEVSNAIDHGVHTALGGFGNLIRGITGSLQEASNLSRQAADRTRDADVQAIDNTIVGFRDFVVNLATGLGDISSKTADETKDTKVASTASASEVPAAGASHNNSAENMGADPVRAVVVEASRHSSPSRREQAPLDSGPRPIIPETKLPDKNGTQNLSIPNPLQKITVKSSRDLSSSGPANRVLDKNTAGNSDFNPLQRSLASQIPSLSGLKQAPAVSGPRQETGPHFLSESPPTRQTSVGPLVPIRRQGIDSVPRYHRPGPIHLPHHATLTRPTSMYFDHAPSARSGYVDHLRRSHSTENVDGLEKMQTAGLPRAAARFPTLEQFEGRNFASAPSFPALPSMEPLVPQRATNHSASKAPDTHWSTKSDVAGPSQGRPEQQPINPLRLSMNDGINLGNSTDTQFSSILQQNSATQQQSVGVYGQNLAKNRRQQQIKDGFPAPPVYPQGRSNALEEYQPQLKLLEQWNRKRGSMVMQEQAIEKPKYEPRLTASEEQDAVANAPEPPGAFPKAQTFDHSEGDNGQPEELIEHGFQPESRPSSAARLAEPFDPLEVEPSARPHLTEGIRRNATVAGTNNRYDGRRRRPYSEAFDGNGRLAWDSFLYPASRTPAGSREPGLTWHQEILGKGPARNQRRQEQLRRSATLYDTARRSGPSFRRYNDDREDDSTVSKINACVDQLVDLGFGSDEEGPNGRLLVYAQATGGDLVDAIDMIDEEQRAYKERL